MASTCYGCGAVIELTGPVGRRSVCLRCDADLHCCICCRHYDPSAAHQCREPGAEQIVDKESANACDLFQMGDGASRRRVSASAAARNALAALFGEQPPPREEPRDALDALFRKK